MCNYGEAGSQRNGPTAYAVGRQYRSLMVQSSAARLLWTGQMLNNFIRQQSNWLNKTHSSITEVLTAVSLWVFSAAASGVF